MSENPLYPKTIQDVVMSETPKKPKTIQDLLNAVPEEIKTKYLRSRANTPPPIRRSKPHPIWIIIRRLKDETSATHQCLLCADTLKLNRKKGNSRTWYTAKARRHLQLKHVDCKEVLDAMEANTICGKAESRKRSFASVSRQLTMKQVSMKLTMKDELQRGVKTFTTDGLKQMKSNLWHHACSKLLRIGILGP